MKLAKHLFLATVVAAGASCRNREFIEPLVGFIPGTIPLTFNPNSESYSYKNHSMSLGDFKSVLVHDVQLVSDGGDPDGASALAIQFRNEIISVVGLPAASGLGPGVLEIRAVITGLEANEPLFNIAPQTQVRRRGYGFVAVEMYAIDGGNAAPVAAYADTQDTQRFSAEKLSTWGSAQAGLKSIADAFGTLLKSK
ncbi:MAG: DUF3313 domain-containing protein [Planctomycetes bacterium]|nr:DUF3313 domain-containing protein [Planctomycetota bacterium]